MSQRPSLGPTSIPNTPVSADLQGRQGPQRLPERVPTTATNQNMFPMMCAATPRSIVCKASIIMQSKRKPITCASRMGINKLWCRLYCKYVSWLQRVCRQPAVERKSENNKGRGVELARHSQHIDKAPFQAGKRKTSV